MRKVIDTYNNLVMEKDFEYDLLITVMEEEGKGLWIVLNEMISGCSITIPPNTNPDTNEVQLAFNRGGVIGAANFIVNNLSKMLNMHNVLCSMDYNEKITNHIKESDAFGFIKRYM